MCQIEIDQQLAELSQLPQQQLNAVNSECTAEKNINDMKQYYSMACDIKSLVEEA